MTNPKTIYREIVKEMNCGFALYRLITDNSGKPLDYEFIEINPAFENLTGLKRKQVVGKTANNVLRDLQINPEKRINQYAETALDGKPIYRCEYWPPLKKWFHVSAFQPWEGYFATIFNDVMQFQESEEKRALTLHELKTPLNTIIGFSDLLTSSLSDSIQASYATAIKKAGQTLLDLIEKMMSSSKDKPGEPTTPAQDETTPTDTLSFEEIEFQNARVLVVDDVSANRFLIQAFLSKINLEFIEAENGEEAVEMAKNSHPDLILMDIMMPVLNGYEAAKILKSDPDTRDIPLIALTAATRPLEREKINEHEFNGFLAKPVEFPTLLKQLIRFLPHSIERNSTPPPNPPSPSPPDPMAIQDLPGLINSLEKEMTPLWEEIKGAVDIEEVESFAMKLETLAQQHGAQDLLSYAHALIEDIESFDIENIEKKLSGFSAVVENLKNTLNLKPEDKADA